MNRCIAIGSDPSSSSGSGKHNGLALIPHPIEADWDLESASRLAGFPVNLRYGALRRTGNMRVTYYFDPASFRENEVSLSMRYFPRQESEFSVEVIIHKPDAAIETRKYRGSQLVCSAHGADFRMAMIHATLAGLEPGEPTDRL